MFFCLDFCDIKISESNSFSFTYAKDKQIKINIHNTDH